VAHGLVAVHGDGVAGGPQRLAVGLALVPQRVVLRGDDQRRRQAREVVGEEGRVPPVARDGDGAVLLLEPVHRVLRQEGALGVLLSRRMTSPGLGRRVDQRLEAQLRATGVASEEGHDGGQVAAGAVAANGDAGRVALDRVGVDRHPLGGGEAVFDGRRELGLGRQAVVDADDDGLGLGAQLAGHRVVAVDAADREPSAVEEQQDRERPVALRPVHPDRDLAGRAGDRPVVGAGELGRLAAGGSHHLVGGPRLLDGAVAEAGVPRGGGVGLHHLEDGVQGHRRIVGR
jgi:hypothetical protein